MSNVIRGYDTSGRYTPEEMKAIAEGITKDPIIRFADEPCDYCEGEGDILAVPPGLAELEEVACPDCCGTGKRLIQPEPKPGGIVVRFGDGR